MNKTAGRLGCPARRPRGFDVFICAFLPPLRSNPSVLFWQEVRILVEDELSMGTYLANFRELRQHEIRLSPGPDSPGPPMR